MVEIAASDGQAVSYSVLARFLSERLDVKNGEVIDVRYPLWFCRGT